MDKLQSILQGLPPTAVYAVVAVLVFSEAAIFVGMVLPGETAVVLGGVLASQGVIKIVPLCIIVVVAAILGDTVGFEVGRHFGDRIIHSRFVSRYSERLEGAQDFLQKRGGPAVFLGRWTAFFRAVLPALAGMSKMRYRTFLTFNAIGGLTWGITYAMVGYLAGSSYKTVEKEIGRGAAVITAALIVVGLVIWRQRRKRAEEAAEEESVEEVAEEESVEEVAQEATEQ